MGFWPLPPFFKLPRNRAITVIAHRCVASRANEGGHCDEPDDVYELLAEKDESMHVSQADQDQVDRHGDGNRVRESAP